VRTKYKIYFAIILNHRWAEIELMWATTINEHHNIAINQRWSE
jgi:hypothetical protein